MNLFYKWIASLTPSTAMNLRTLQHYDSPRDTLDEPVQPASLREALYDRNAHHQIGWLEFGVSTTSWTVEFRINVVEVDSRDVVFRTRAELAARHNESWKKHYGVDPGAR